MKEWIEQVQQQAKDEIESPSSAADGDLKEQVLAALKTVYDPEIPVNIYDLGLIYEVEIDDDNKASVQMTLTAPGCPVAQTFPGTVENVIRQVEGINDAEVELVWDPPWSPDRMSEAARLQLGML